MKTNLKSLGLCLAGSMALLTGCEPPERTSSPSPSTNISAREMKKEVREAVDATKTYAAENKDQFVASVQEKLNQLDRQISELGAKTENLKDEAKAESNRALTGLREKRAQLGLKLEELKNASQEAWKDVKAGFEAAFADLQKAFQEAKAKFGN